MYPLDKITKEGRPFWSLPKRPPHPVEFDPTNSMHAALISSLACLYANEYGITIPYEQPRSEQARLEMAQIALKFEQKDFVPND